MKKVWLLASLGLLASCGGGGGGLGGDVSGFYSLSVSLKQSDITSLTVSGNPPDISIPPDNIEGQVSLSYSGSLSNPLKGVIKNAQLCLEGLSCYRLPISGVLTPNGSPIDFSVSLSAYKFNSPWINVNPYEDIILSTTLQTDSLTSSGTSKTKTDKYSNTVSNVQLDPQIAKKSLMLSGAGDFSKSYTYSKYSSSSGTVNVVLPRGSDPQNQIKPSSVKLTAGTLKCKDDGSGNIVDDDGTASGTCSGNIDYNSGNLSFQIKGVNDTDVNIDYVVAGEQWCWDNGNGGLEGDCTGSVDYQAGQVSYKFSDNFIATPAPVNISWTQVDAYGNTITYVLPPPTMVSPYVYLVSGREIDVYQGNNWLCSKAQPTNTCRVSVKDNVVNITFPNGVLTNLSLKYTQDKKVDINPNIDVSNNRLSSATVNGYVEVEVKLESGETLTARAPITFRVVPK